MSVIIYTLFEYTMLLKCVNWTESKELCLKIKHLFKENSKFNCFIKKQIVQNAKGLIVSSQIWI